MQGNKNAVGTLRKGMDNKRNVRRQRSVPANTFATGIAHPNAKHQLVPIQDIYDAVVVFNNTYPRPT